MFATGHPDRNHSKAWQILFCLTLLSFLFRSAAPAGYMPNVTGPHDRILTVTLCDAAGAASLQLLVPTTPTPHPPGHDGVGHACPFCSVVTQAIAPGANTLALAATGIPYRLAPALGDSPLPTTVVVGPPLGSRAPPSILG